MTRLTGRYSRAVEKARECHDGVPRKGTDVPYLAHVLAVSALVLEHGGNEDQAIAGLLHDVAEDAGGRQRLDEVTAEFGSKVGSIVEACSDSLIEDPEHKEPWWPRKVHYIEHLSTIEKDALLVAAADKTHNAQALLLDYAALGESIWERFNPESGRAGQLWYQREVSAVLLARSSGTPAQGLAERHAEIVRTLVSMVEANVGRSVVEDDLAGAAASAGRA